MKEGESPPLVKEDLGGLKPISNEFVEFERCLINQN